jgi:dTDP-4-dehydrorhamnose reductase
MKAVIFGSTGKVGQGLVSGLENSVITSLYQPLRSELDLLNSNGVEEYIYNISPDVIIQAAGLTTNKESSGLKIKEVFRFNSAINKMLQKLLGN